MPTSTSIQSHTPIELLGSSTGISVIDPSTVLSRLWYFDGRFLRASGFRQDQDYVRALVALSNQAVGHGVVSGFNASLGQGDVLAVDGGLGLARSGRPVYLPSAVQLSIPTLINRSSGVADPAVAPAPGAADFSPCPPEGPMAEVDTVRSATVYLLTVAAAEALCGEEEKFGQLCENACASESDRSVAVEGVVFRARPVVLSLPVAATVPFTGIHHRSRVASAWFAAEREEVAAMISGAGLRSGVWCSGAPGVGGDEIPLAVFDRTGATTTWVDLWTARREINETSPQRYWSRRFAMRPLDVFWAQILQFQCQLLALAAGGPGGGGGADPCGDERQALEVASAVLAGFVGGSRVAAGPPAAVVAPGGFDPTVPAMELPGLARDRLAELSALIDRTLQGRAPSATGSLLLDGGIVELPSGGYLPVDPDRDLQAQVRAFMGPGVDLRFCAVRPDFVPEALQEVQHMERISLTAGIDDPDAVEEVDILVPGGRITEEQPHLDAYEGLLRVLVGRRGEASLQLRVVAREHPDEPWSWTAAGHTETRPGLRFADVRLATAAFVRGTEVADPEVRARIADLKEDAAGFRLRLPVDGARRGLARSRAVARVGNPTIGTVTPTLDLPETVAVWLDLSLDRDLRSVTPGERVGARWAATFHAVNNGEEEFGDFVYRGDLLVIERHSGANGVVRIRTAFAGFVDQFTVDDGTVDQRDVSLKEFGLEWEVAANGPDGAVQVALVRLADTGADGVSLVVQFQGRGAPRQVDGRLFEQQCPGDGNTPATRDYATGSMTGSPGALDPGTFGHDLADAVLEIIGAVQERTGRDRHWKLAARQRMLGGAGTGGGAVTVRSDADWVLFHRRRTKVCGAGVVDRPVANRVYRWYHAHLDDLDAAAQKRLAAMLASSSPEERDALLAELGFRLVSSPVFAERRSELVSSPVVLRADWSATVTSRSLFAAAVADPPTGDGPSAALGRLASGLSAVANLVDTAGLPSPTVIPQIPVEFQTPGTDGVIFTLGTSPAGEEPPPDPEPDTARATLVRIPLEALDLVESLDGPLTVERLIRQLANFPINPTDLQPAFFTGDDLANKDEVAAWWGPDRPLLAARLGMPAGASPETVGRWVDRRTAVVVEILNGAEPPSVLERTTWDLVDADVVLLLFDDGRGGIDLSDAVVEVVLREQPDFRRAEFQMLERAVLAFHPSVDDLRRLTERFGGNPARVSWDQPLNEVARQVIRALAAGPSREEFVVTVRDRWRRR